MSSAILFCKFLLLKLQKTLLQEYFKWYLTGRRKEQRQKSK